VVIVAEARSRDQKKLVAQTVHMREVFEKEAAALGAVARVEIIGEYPAYRLEKDSAVIAIATKAAVAAGLTPGLVESGGGSDGNHFNAFGVPTVVLATGMEKVHTHDEFCRISDMVKDVAWILEIVQAAAAA
jgi:tripeptide aminopeptidase